MGSSNSIIKSEPKQSAINSINSSIRKKRVRFATFGQSENEILVPSSEKSVSLISEEDQDYYESFQGYQMDGPNFNGCRVNKKKRATICVSILSKPKEHSFLGR